MLRWILWTLIIIGSAAAQVVADCETTIQVGQDGYSFGGLNAFYSIAKGMSDGLQKNMDSSVINDIYNYVDGEGEKSLGSIINEVISAQAGAIAFFTVGIVLIATSLIIFLVVCSLRVCCNSCGANKKFSYSSRIPIFIYLFLLFASFVFILTGIIIANISATNLYNTIDTSATKVQKIAYDTSVVMTSGTSQMTCAVTQDLNEPIVTLTTQMENFPGNLFDVFYSKSGLLALENTNYMAINMQLDIITTDGDETTKSLGLIQNVDNECSTQIEASKAGITQLQMKIGIAKQAVTAAQTAQGTTINQITSQVQPYQNQVTAKTNDAVKQVTTSVNQVTDTMNQIQFAVNDSMQIVYNVADSITKAHDKIISWKGYSSAQKGIQAGFSLPSAIALAFAFVVFGGLLFLLFSSKSSSMGSKGGGYCACTGFYIVILLSVAAMGFTSAMFVAGWGVSGVCVPMFQDPSFAAYDAIPALKFTIQGISGNVSITPSQLLTQCRANATMFTAANGSVLINEADIMGQINLDQYVGPVETITNSSNLSYNIDATSMKLVTAAIQNLQDINNADWMTQPLSSCTPSPEVNTAITNITNMGSDLTAAIKRLEDLDNNLQTAANMSQQQTEIKQDMSNFTIDQFVQANNTVANAINKTLMDLSNKVFPCFSVYAVYTNAGSLLCDQFGRPIQGIWAALGLAAVFFIPLALVLLFSSNWLFGARNTAPRRVVYADDEVKPNYSGRDWDQRSADSVFPKPLYRSTAPSAAEFPYDDRAVTEQPLYSGAGLYPSVGDNWESGVAATHGQGLYRASAPEYEHRDSGSSGGLRRMDPQTEQHNGLTRRN